MCSIRTRWSLSWLARRLSSTCDSKTTLNLWSSTTSWQITQLPLSSLSKEVLRYSQGQSTKFCKSCSWSAAISATLWKSQGIGLVFTWHALMVRTKQLRWLGWRAIRIYTVCECIQTCRAISTSSRLRWTKASKESTAIGLIWATSLKANGRPRSYSWTPSGLALTKCKPCPSRTTSRAKLLKTVELSSSGLKKRKGAPPFCGRASSKSLISKRDET